MEKAGVTDPLGGFGALRLDGHVGLGIALQRLGARRGVDVSRSGVAALSPAPDGKGMELAEFAATVTDLGAVTTPYPDADLTVTAPGEESGTFDSFVERA